MGEILCVSRIIWRSLQNHAGPQPPSSHSSSCDPQWGRPCLLRLILASSKGPQRLPPGTLLQLSDPGHGPGLRFHLPPRAGHLRVLGMLWVPPLGQPALLMAQGIFPWLPGELSYVLSRPGQSTVGKRVSAAFLRLVSALPHCLRSPTTTTVSFGLALSGIPSAVLSKPTCPCPGPQHPTVSLRAPIL